MKTMFESKFWSVVERMCLYVRTCVWFISEFHRLKIQYLDYDWLKCICWLFKLLIFGLKLFYRFCFLLTYIKCFFFAASWIFWAYEVQGWYHGF